MPRHVEAVRDRLRGVATGLLTPFDDENEVEYWKIEENAETLFEKGARTFLSTANISEYHSLSHEERINVTEANRNALPSEACLLAGVGGSTSEAQALIRAYDRVGVDAMMIMPPDHSYLHERGLLDYHRKLARVTETPLVPYVNGYDPSIAFLVELASLDGVAGIKYAIEDPVKLGAATTRSPDEVVWVDGLAEPYAVSFWAEGAEGFSAGVSNFRPEVGLALYDALTRGEWTRARALRNICLPYQTFRGKSGQDNDLTEALSVPAVKKGLDLAGMHGGTVREPIRPLSEEEAEQATELYNQLDDEIDRLLEQPVR